MDCRVAREYAQPVKVWSWIVQKRSFELVDGQRTYVAR